MFHFKVSRTVRGSEVTRIAAFSLLWCVVPARVFVSFDKNQQLLWFAVKGGNYDCDVRVHAAVVAFCWLFYEIITQYVRKLLSKPECRHGLFGGLR